MGANPLRDQLNALAKRVDVLEAKERLRVKANVVSVPAVANKIPLVVRAAEIEQNAKTDEN